MKRFPLFPINRDVIGEFLNRAMMIDMNKRAINVGNMHFHARCLLFVVAGGS